MTDERKKVLKLSSNMVTVSFKGGPINPIEDGPPTPPTCPKCDEPLETVELYEYSTWNYNKETGSYQCGDLYGGSAEVQCFHCNTDLGELFPEGPINYGHSLLEGLNGHLKPKEVE